VSSVAIVSPDLLAALEAALRRAGAPVARHLRPGLGDAQLEEVARSLGRPLPPEVSCWWRWHDGADPDTGHAQDSTIGPGLCHLSAADALANHDLSLRIARETGPSGSGDASFWWQPEWVPLLRADSGAIVAGDFSQLSATVPIHVIDWKTQQDRDEWAVPVLGSLGALVTWWIEALAEGVWTYSPEQGWDSKAAAIWPSRELTGLV
jgi:cell wall assembly regulator SMI1